MHTPGVPPTRTGTDSTPRHAPISKRRYDREARVLGLRNETVTREVLTDLLTIDDALPHPRPHAGGRCARLRRADAAQPVVNGMEEFRFESPKARLLRRLSDIRPKHAPNINARGCWDRRSPWRVVHIATSRS